MTSNSALNCLLPQRKNLSEAAMSTFTGGSEGVGAGAVGPVICISTLIKKKKSRAGRATLAELQIQQQHPVGEAEGAVGRPLTRLLQPRRCLQGHRETEAVRRNGNLASELLRVVFYSSALIVSAAAAEVANGVNLEALGRKEEQEIDLHVQQVEINQSNALFF